MPPYATSGGNTTALNTALPTALWPGDDFYFFGTAPYTPGQIQKPNDSNAVPEAVTIGERSIAAALATRPGGGSAPALMVQVIASANPGAAEIDIQDAAIDADGAYATPNNAAYKITAFTAIGGGQYSAFAELNPENVFVTAKIVANPNAVNWIVKARYV